MAEDLHTQPSSLWGKLRAAFHKPNSPHYSTVQTTVWVLILFSIGLFLLEPFLGDIPALVLIDKVVLAFFAIEIVLRIATVRSPELDFFNLSPSQRLWIHIKSRLFYCLRPLVFIDILTVLALVPALRGLRALRLLRLLRSKKLFRYSQPFQGIIRAFDENILLFVFAFACLGILILVGGISIFLVEADANANISSLADGFWWALVTLTTVGFGDISPVTPLGRIIGSALMIAGMFMLALFAGIVGSTLLHVIMTLREEQFRMRTYTGHIIICGYNEGTRMLLDELQRESTLEQREVLIMADQERPLDVPPRFVWIRGEPTKETELDKVRPSHASALLIVASRHLPPQQADAVTLMTIFTVRSYLRAHPQSKDRVRPLNITAEILEPENVAHARVAGANEIVETTRMGFSIMAHSASTPGTVATVARVVSAGSHSFYSAPFPSTLQPKQPMTFLDLSRWCKTKHNVLLVGLRDTRDHSEILNPPDDTLVHDHHHLFYLADQPSLGSDFEVHDM